jgi:predicted Rossmann fold nucleotide-binding protein DprA/Smf involved in DNA uptake
MAVMKVGIVGSRDYPDLDRVRDYVNELPGDTVVVSGGARGVDLAAEQAAKERGLEVIVFRPSDPSNPESYLSRNRQIVENSDRLVAFWYGRSRGTAYTIQYANKTGKEVKIL